jgi:hypothetical protein
MRHSAVITKDFHFAKAFRQIRGKSFVIMVGAVIPAGLSWHIRHAPGPGKGQPVP